MPARTKILSDLQALRGIIDAVPHPVFVKDEDHRFVVVNQAMCGLMGRSFEELVGRTDYDFVPSEQADIFAAHDRFVLQTGEPNENEEQFSGGNGGVRTVVTGKKRLVLSDGSLLVVGCINDITEFRRAESYNRHIAEHDALTGLANRSLLRARLDEALDAARRGDQGTALLLVDLDGFKNINDALGHAAGDDLLIQTARILTDLGGPDAVVGRLGGDEFAIIHRAVNQPQAAQALAAAVIEHLSKPMSLGRRQAFISASVGVATVGPDIEDDDALKRHADHALYAAKKAGRNTWRLFEPAMEIAHLVTRVMEEDLRAAVEKREFSVAYQPFVGVTDLAVHGFEALLRWTHPQRGLIDPAVFIPIAERTGAISTLGEWILHEACAAATKWPAAFRVAVNVSPVQFARGDLPDLVRTIVRDTGIDPQRLELEITETAVIKDVNGARRVADALHAQGVHLVLDDFGAGYSSLQILKSLPFDKMKIDRSLLADVGISPKADAIIGAILQLSRTLGLSVTAEGVETKEQLRVLRRESCEEVQGFLFGRPTADAAYALAPAGVAEKKRA